MKLLALETSTENCSVALLNDGKTIFKSQLAPQKHAEMILQMVDDLIKKGNISKDDLLGIVLGVGPGSFTGVRIATSTAQGLALGLSLKVALVTSLEALAFEALSNKSAEYVVSSIDARMGEVYVAVYKVNDKSLSLLDEERVLKPEEAVELISSLVKNSTSVVCAGSGIDILYNCGLSSEYEKLAAFPQAQYILDKGAKLFERDKAVDPEYALPLYVRNDVAWKKVSEQK